MRKVFERGFKSIVSDGYAISVAPPKVSEKRAEGPEGPTLAPVLNQLNRDSSSLISLSILSSTRDDLSTL